MSTPTAEHPATPTRELSYDQTVSRALVHRWALSEVFLCDSHRTDDTHFTAAAQLPLSHGYFRDHPGGEGHHDTLLVLESCRQAVTYAAHVHQGVPRQTTFMVTSWGLDIDDATALRCGERPGELHIDGRITHTQQRGGRLRRLVFAMRLTLDATPLGTLTMDVSCTPTDQYHQLRRMQRGTDVPTAFTLPATPAATPVTPAHVARRNPHNVVLDGAHTHDGHLSAHLSPRTFANRSMYDHPYDHVPAMVFSEAARQCALLLRPSHTTTNNTNTTATATAGSVPQPLHLHGTFQRFAELDDEVHLTATPLTDPETTPTAGPDTFRMTARQQDHTVAEITLTLG